MENRKQESQIIAPEPKLIGVTPATCPEKLLSDWIEQDLIRLEKRFCDFVTNESSRSSVGR